jgi:hypothetical protein
MAMGIAATTFAFCEPAPASKHDHQHDTVAMFLKPESKQLVEKFLKSKGIANPHVDYVCVNGRASKASRYVFEPLYGERAAFRLKGMITLGDGRIVGVGRASNMVGELKDDEVEVSLPIHNGDVSTKPSDPHSLQELQDLPTRLIRFSAAYERPMWKGRLPSASIDGREYPAIKATWVRFPVDHQIVLDGHLCSRTHFDSDNHACTFDRTAEIVASILGNDSHEEPAEQTPPKSETKPSEDVSQTENGTEEDDEDAKETCPVCRYLKKGPCKPEFLDWDTCMKSLQPGQEVTVCFDATTKMMRCMRKYEYYDIMTAGTDFSRLDEADALRKQHEESTAANNTKEGATTEAHSKEQS